jgi:single-strand DNA-binding protein
MNTISLTGRVVADHDGVKQVGENKVLNFRVASDVGFGDRKSTLWLSCALWNKRAESLAPMLSKGQFVAITGELSQREYEKDGQTRTSLELRVGDLDLGPKALSGAGGGQQPSAPAGQVEDEIPF